MFIVVHEREDGGRTYVDARAGVHLSAAMIGALREALQRHSPLDGEFWDALRLSPAAREVHLCAEEAATEDAPQVVSAVVIAADPPEEELETSFRVGVTPLLARGDGREAVMEIRPIAPESDELRGESDSDDENQCPPPEEWVRWAQLAMDHQGQRRPFTPLIPPLPSP